MACRYLVYNHWYDMSLLDTQSLVWPVATWYTCMTLRYLIYNHWYDMSLLDIKSLVPVWNVATWYTTVVSLAWQLAGFVWNTPNAGLTLCHHISRLFFNFTCLEKNQPLYHTLLFTLIEVTWLVGCWMYEVFVYRFGNNIMITVIGHVGSPQWSMCMPQ